ncbi:LysR family transcriptional regulator [Vibrio maritimus]|uniref:LysR family transcriptional regulator n=1 Tax=Vibrio maritimus TaxID=990268 RepID=UPI0040695D64
MIDLNLVRVFVAVFQQGSYTRASVELEMSQPAVSLAIKRLEKTLGYNLFVKQGRGVVSTAQAKALAHELEPALIRIDNALSAKQEITAYCTEAILHFLGEIDGVKFQPSLEQHHKELEDLRSNSVELVIAAGISKDTAFVAEELLSEKIVVVCRQGHPRITGETLTQEQFLAEQQVTLKARHHGQQLIDMYVEEFIPKRQERVEASSLASVLTMLPSTNYLGIVTESFARHWSEAMGLKILPLPFKTSSISLQMIYHRRHEGNAHHQVVRNAIKDRLAKQKLL